MVLKLSNRSRRGRQKKRPSRRDVLGGIAGFGVANTLKATPAAVTGIVSGAAVSDLTEGAGILTDDWVIEPIEDLMNTGVAPGGEKLIGSPYVDRRIEGKKRRRRNKYLSIKNNTAAARVGTIDRRSRLEYAQDIFEGAALPETLQELLPYVPFQESSYRLNANSGVALGPWQFRKSTGAKYGLVRGGKDYRKHFTRSTEAAKDYFEDIYQKLKGNKHYQILKRRYGLGSVFLELITVNAYNSGEGHMERALEVMATHKSARAHVDKFGRGGDLSLFEYLTREYIKHYKRYQQGPPYYHKESADYVYNIIAYRDLDKGNDLLASVSNGVTRLPSVGELAGDNPEVVGALGGAATYRAGKKFFGKENFFSRRGALKTLAASVSGAVGGHLGWTRVADNTKHYGGKALDLVDEYIDFDMPKEFFGEVVNNFNAGDITKHLGDIRALANQSGITLETDVVESKNYPFNQRMGDAAFEKFQESGEEKYLQLSYYYYQRALQLAEAQKSGKYKLPDGGMAKIRERINYCKHALEIIGAEFRH